MWIAFVEEAMRLIQTLPRLASPSLFILITVSYPQPHTMPTTQELLNDAKLGTTSRPATRAIPCLQKGVSTRLYSTWRIQHFAIARKGFECANMYAVSKLCQRLPEQRYAFSFADYGSPFDVFQDTAVLRHDFPAFFRQLVPSQQTYSEHQCSGTRSISARHQSQTCT